VSRQLNADDLSMAIQENQQVLLQKRAVPIFNSEMSNNLQRMRDFRTYPSRRTFTV
jgi:hypothetical protein